MLRFYTILYTVLFFIILDALSISMAQVINNNTLLPKLDECGQLKWEEYEDRSGKVRTNEFPWLARVVYFEPRLSSNKIPGCTAVLINQRYLLTVAYCADDGSGIEAYGVLFGNTANISEDAIAAQQLAIEEVVIHPFFNRFESKNDIALLRLNETISYTNSIRPICLPGPNIKDKEFGAEQLIAAGRFTGSDVTNVRKMPVAISNVQDCRRKYSGVWNITDTHMCGITCFEKFRIVSGSPLMDIIGRTNYYLAGLASARFKTACMYPQEPNIFTRVDRFIDWIEYNIRA